MHSSKSTTDSGKSWFSQITFFFSQILFQLLETIKQVLKLSEAFFVNNFERVVQVCFLFVAMLLLKINLYISVSVGIVYLVYSVNLSIKETIDQLQKDGAAESQEKKRNAMNALPGFSEELGITPEKFEILSRAIYDWFRESPQHLISQGFVHTLAGCGYGELIKMDELASTAIKMAFTRNDKHKSLLVLTAGTDIQETDATLIADMDAEGPGRQAFLTEKFKIIEAISDASRDMDYINISGHSFGGAISMMMAVELMRQILTDHGKLEHIQAINVCVYQSAGVNESVASEAKRLLNELNESKPDFRLNFICHHHDYDPIPGSGAQILSDYEGDNAEVFFVRRHALLWTFLLIFFRLDFLGQAHSAFVYDQTGYLNKHDDRRWLARAGSVAEYYCLRDEDRETRDHIIDKFTSTPTKFFCNGTLHQFFLSYQPEFWQMLKTGLVFGIFASVLCINFGYVVFAPGIVNFMNCFLAVDLALIHGSKFYELNPGPFNYLLGNEVSPKRVEGVKGAVNNDAESYIPSSRFNLINNHIE
jgi:hypothetical protein